MPTLPTTKDVRQARKQADADVNATFDTVKYPLFAALGTVDGATHALADRVQQVLHDLQSRVSDMPAELGELRTRLELPALIRLARDYREAVQGAYASRVERGEEVFDQFRTRPQVKWAFDSVESGVDTAQERLEVVLRELNSAIADLLTRFAQTSRSVGEKVARNTDKATATAAQRVRETGRVASERVQETADDLSEAVTEAGDEVAFAARSTSRKAANRVVPPRRAATQPPGTSGT